MGRSRGPKPKTYSHFQVTLDKVLGSKNLWRKAIAKDGSCLFRAVSEQVLLSQTYHHHVRLQCADYISRHRDDFKEFLTVKVEEYLRRLRSGQLWGGEVELVVFSKMYRRSIVVFNQQVNQVQEQIFFSPEDEAAGRRPEELLDPIFLAYSDGNHYDSVYLKKHKNSMAFCQSLVYSLLYERVFEETLSQATKLKLKNLFDSDVQRLATEGEKGDKHLTFLSKTYPIGVLEAMGPNCFSNTPLHVYQRERDCIERQDRDVAAAIQFQIGDKCLVQVPGELTQVFSGEITSKITSNGCHSVYIYEVGETWEFPCRDITVPSPSLSPASSAGRRAGGGPPQAWSKVHQKIQPGFPRGKQSSDDSPSPSSSLLPLPNNLLPISSTHSHLPSPSIPPPMATDSQQKTYQTLPKATNGTKTASTKPHGRPVTVPSGNLPMATSRAPAGRELGVAPHQVVRRSGEVVGIDTQVRRVSGRGGGGAGILGVMPPGFPGGKDPIAVPKPQKVSDADKPASHPERPAVPDPHERKLPPSPPPTSAPPQQPAVGNPLEHRPLPHPASFPPSHPKSAVGPKTSPNTSDESTTTSSEECANGAPPGNPAPSATPIPYFFPHPMGRYVILSDGQPTIQIPNQPPGPHPPGQVPPFLERPLMHAPQPHPLVQHVGRQAGETGRESPYFDPQVNHARSSQPEEAWPMVGEEEPRPNPQAPPPEQASSPPGHLPPHYVFPFGIPPPSDQGIPLMRPAHFPRMPPGGPAPPGVPQHMFPFFLTPHQPFPTPQQPHPLEIDTDSKEVQTSPCPSPSPVLQKDKEVDVRPITFSVGLQCTGVGRRDSETNTEPQGVHHPLFLSDDIKPPAVSAQAFLLSGDVHGQIRVLTEYAEQCLRLYEKAEPDLASPVLALVEGLGARVQAVMEEREKKLREMVRAELRKEVRKEIWEEVKDEVWEEVKDEVWEEVKDDVWEEVKDEVWEEVKDEMWEEVKDEIWEEVKEEVKGEVREEVKEEVKGELRDEVKAELLEEMNVMHQKPLNMDEQNFLQLLTTPQQSLPESHSRPSLLPRPRDQGRYPGFFPPFPASKLAASSSRKSVEEEEEADPLTRDGEVNEDEQEGLPHQEASVPPYPQMAPGPMMVPPGARPMVVPMQGMPWYHHHPHYMPFARFLMSPRPLAPPHTVPQAPEQGAGSLDELSSSSQNDLQLAEEIVDYQTRVETGREPTADATSTDSGVVGDGGTTASKEIPRVTAPRPPFTFPSADLQADIDDIDDIEAPEFTTLTFTNKLPPSSSPMEIKPRANQPSTEWVSPPLLPPLAALTEPATGQKGAGPRPGLPCRGRGAGETTDRAADVGEELTRDEWAEPVAVAPPTKKGKGGRQHSRSRNRDSHSSGGGGKKSGHREKRRGQFSADPPTQSTGGHTHSSPVDSPAAGTSSPKTPDALTPPKATPTSRSGEQDSSTVQSATTGTERDDGGTAAKKGGAERVKKGGTEGAKKSGDEGVKKSGDEGAKKSGGEGVKRSGDEGLKKSGDEEVKKGGDEGVKKGVKSGGAGGKGVGTKVGGRASGGGGGKGGRSKVEKDGANNAAEVREERKEVAPAPVVKREEKRSPSAEAATETGKSTRQAFNRTSNQRHYRARRTGGGGGASGSRSHRTPQSSNSKAPSPSSNPSDTPTQRPPAGRGGGKSGRGESKPKAKNTNSVPDSGNSQSQEPTRGSRESPQRPSPERVVEQLPSFKNLYSSTPEAEEVEEEVFQSQESWPSMTQIDHDHPVLPPLEPPPPLPSLPALNPLSVGRDLFTIFPALLPHLLTDTAPAAT